MGLLDQWMKLVSHKPNAPRPHDAPPSRDKWTNTDTDFFYVAHAGDVNPRPSLAHYEPHNFDPALGNTQMYDSFQRQEGTEGAAGVYRFGWGEDQIELKGLNSAGRFNQQQRPFTIGHEVGHAKWHQAMDRNTRDRWKKLHAKTYGQETPKITQGMVPYWDEPSHSFAGAYGDFVNDPEAVRKTNPEIYKFFQNLTQQSGPPMRSLENRRKYADRKVRIPFTPKERK